MPGSAVSGIYPCACLTKSWRPGFDGRTVGYMVVLHSLGGAGKLLHVVSTRLAFVGTISIILVLGISYFIARRVTRPIELLAAGALELGRGNYEYKIDLSPDGRVVGTYLHGLFDSPAVTVHWLTGLGLDASGVPALGGLAARDREYERLADHLDAHVDVDRILAGAIDLGGETGQAVYDVENVLFTQYYDQKGDALHLNYWRPVSVFGNTPTSHGCVGMLPHDAQYFWLFGAPGMRVEIHA